MIERQKIYRAGVIPYFVDADDKIKMLFMKPSNSNFGGDIDSITGEYVLRYQLAKGRVEQHETAQEAALREGEEEVGLVADNIFGMWHVGNFLGRTDVYVAKIKDPSNFVQHHYETESTKWMTLDEFEVDGRELHRDLVRQAHSFMEMCEYGTWC